MSVSQYKPITTQQQAGTASADVTGETRMTVLLSYKTGRARSTSAALWTDLHGPLAARLPGIKHYVQWHFRSDIPTGWPEIANVDMLPPSRQCVDGIAEMAFSSSDDLALYRKVAHETMLDEPNLFRRSVRYLVDAGEDLGNYSDFDFTSREGTRRYFVLLRVTNRCSTESVQEMLSAWEACVYAPKIRLTWLQPRDNSYNAVLSKNVDHDTPTEMQYQLVMDMEFRCPFDVRSFYESEHFMSTHDAMRRCFSAIHSYEISGKYVFVTDGRLTLNGLRGASTANLILQEGAVNQISETVMKLFLCCDREVKQVSSAGTAK